MDRDLIAGPKCPKCGNGSWRVIMDNVLINGKDAWALKCLNCSHIMTQIRKEPKWKLSI